MDTVSRIKSLFTELDKEVSTFQLKTGLRCPPGCGSCCQNGTVYATVLEMMPAACEIFRQGRVSSFEALLHDRTDAGLCIFFLSDPPKDNAGHCAFYDWRPGICRLHGYAGVRTRLGTVVLAACKTMKHGNQGSLAAATKRQSEAPLLSDYGRRVYAIDPVLGNQSMPINTALRQSIGRIGLRLMLRPQDNPGLTTAA